MSGNSIGKLFTVTTFGESHGLAIGCIVDGCPPGLELTEAERQGLVDFMNTLSDTLLGVNPAFGSPF